MPTNRLPHNNEPLFLPRVSPNWQHKGFARSIEVCRIPLPAQETQEKRARLTALLLQGAIRLSTDHSTEESVNE